MALRSSAGTRDYIRTLAPRPRKEIRAALRLIAEDPRHPKLDLKLLRVKGARRVFRIRVGDYRIVFTPRPGHTFVLRIIHRSEGYDWLERLFP
jgi:mRNA-degrading endonuclease RelE of RelBE toxin-antitoxin system